MLTELRGKGGRLCQAAAEGQLRCPLMVRPTSEDVVTGNLCLVLRTLNSRWWLPDFLNRALSVRRFHRQYHRGLKVEPWRNRPCYPRELLPWDEGSTQIDLTISWENPPTTVYVEMKYGSDVSPKGAGDDGTHGFPSDQLIRNARVGLYECGYFDQNPLFQMPTRDFVLILISPTAGHPLIARYRDLQSLKAAIPKSSRLKSTPLSPFIGELGYADVAELLAENRRWLTRPERLLVDQILEYLPFKVQQIREIRPSGRLQSSLKLD